MMKRTFFIMTFMLAVSAAAVPAQEGTVERDPFYPPEARPGAIAPVPAESEWGGRDPFSNPLAGREPTQREAVREGQSRVLTGIIYSKDVRLAIINGEMLGEGSKVGDKRLVEIRNHSVMFVNATGGREEVFLENFSVGRQ